MIDDDEQGILKLKDLIEKGPRKQARAVVAKFGEQSNISSRNWIILRKRTDSKKNNCFQHGISSPEKLVSNTLKNR